MKKRLWLTHARCFSFRSLSFFYLSVMGLLSSPQQLLAEWALPTELNDTNTTVSFAIDSTWHMVHGKVTGVHGSAWLAQPKSDAKSDEGIQAKIEFPIASFDTDNKSRDKKLRKVMDHRTYPQVIFQLNRISDLCSPQSIKGDTLCHPTLHGTLTIRDKTKPVSIPATIRQLHNVYELKGVFPISWKDFGIEDPSILIARVNETVTVSFTTRLTEKTL